MQVANKHQFFYLSKVSHNDIFYICTNQSLIVLHFVSILGIDVSHDQQKVFIAWQVSRMMLFFLLICVPVYLDHISSIPGKCPIPRRVSAYVPHFKGASNTNQPFLSCMLAANCSLHSRYRNCKLEVYIPGRAPIVVAICMYWGSLLVQVHSVSW